MKKIEAIIRPFKLTPVQEALGDLGIKGFAVAEFMVHPTSEDEAVPMFKIELVLPSKLATTAVSSITKAACTGRDGDGTVLVLPVENAFRIRTGEKGAKTLFF